MCVPSFVRPASAFSAIIQIPFLWKPFPLFPPVNIHTVFDFGQTMVTEQRMLSSDSVFFRRKQRRELV